MAVRLQELCAILVEESSGGLCAQIFSVLAECGRLSRPQLQYKTRIPARQLRHALTVLVQQHIILHHTTDDETSFYQVDWRNTYNIIRSNRIISLVEERYGEGAARIVANLLQLGHARVADLVQASDLDPASKRDNGLETSNEHVNGEAKVNGTGMNHLRKTQRTTISTIAQLHMTLRTLLRAGFLVKVNKRIYTPAADLQSEIEETVISQHFSDRKVNGPKKQAEFKSAINNLKRKWRDANEYSESNDVDSKGVILGTSMLPSKRVKLNGGTSNGASHGNDEDLREENVPKLPNDMTLRVNYAQCTLASRTYRLEQMAESYLGGVTATVYGTLLRLLESKIRARDENLKLDEKSEEDEEDDLPVASTVDVAEALDPDIDLTLGIQSAAGTHKLQNGDAKRKKKMKISEEFADIGIKEEVVSSDDDEDQMNGYSSLRDRNQRLSLIEEHLKLLEEHSKGFCRRVGSGGRGEWRVHFPDLTDKLIQADIDSTVLARFGKIHARIVRLLRERGRLEEKQIAAAAMMRIKDVRAILTELQYAAIVEAQEIPRDAARQPTRTTYLWFHDQTRVQSLILQQTYQGMSRAFQRLEQERQKFKRVIEKAELMDVKQEALNQNERLDLMQWREVEERLLVQVQRMDELVALLRDFSGKDTSLVS